MKIKTISALLAVAILSLALCSCKEEKRESTFYPYKLSNYVELGDYMSIEFEPESDEVTDKDVEDKIKETLKESKLTSEREKESEIVNGDRTVIDFVGYIEGETFEGGSSEGYSLTIGSGQFIDGFESGLVGKKAGDKVSLNLSFPETYHNADYAGKPVVFQVIIQKVYETVYPELTTEILKKISTAKDVDEYKAALKQSVAEEKKQTVATNNYNNFVDLVLKTSEMKKYPKKEVMQYKDKYIANYTQTAQSQGLSIETFVAYNGLTMDKFRELMEQNAQAMVKKEMVFLAIADKENITISDKEYEVGMVDYMNKLGYTSHKSFIQEIGEDRLRGMLTIDKTIQTTMEKIVENEK